MIWDRMPVLTGLGAMCIVFCFSYCYTRYCRCKFNDNTSDDSISEADFADVESCPE